MKNLWYIIDLSSPEETHAGRKPLPLTETVIAYLGYKICLSLNYFLFHWFIYLILKNEHFDDQKKDLRSDCLFQICLLRWIVYF